MVPLPESINGCKDVCLKIKARIWPWLSYMCHIRAPTRAPRTAQALHSLAEGLHAAGLYLLIADVTVYSHSGHPTRSCVPRHSLPPLERHLTRKRRLWTGARLRVGRGDARAEDAQGTPTQSHISPSTLVYKDNCIRRKARSSEYGTHKTFTARFWHWRSGKCP